MFIKVETNYKCSKCGSIEEPKEIQHKNNYYLHCVKCGHKKLISKTTRTEIGTKTYTWHSVNNYNSIEY